MKNLYDIVLENTTITVGQCNQIIDKISNNSFIFLIVVLFILSIIIILLSFKFGKLSSFIRHNNLNDKYQEWNKNEKGLI